MKLMQFAAMLAATLTGTVVLGQGPITLESLLKEMTDREAIARFPDPAYTCKQFSSYDRKSTTPDDPKTWFANGDVNQYLRVEDAKSADGKTHKEWVMADMDGPGAIVRIWSANPSGTLRIYLDNSDKPVIEVPMNDLLGGKWKVGAPLSQECSKGWNLYLPIPYAKHCKITSDKDGFYYQVNYRTYEASASVKSMSPVSIDEASGEITAAQKELSHVRLTETPMMAQHFDLKAGQSVAIYSSTSGASVVRRVAIGMVAEDAAAALRSTILIADFDGEKTTWVPLGDFLAQVAGPTGFQDWYRAVADMSYMESDWLMPFEKNCTLTLLNLGKEDLKLSAAVAASPLSWDSRSMHFHANWHYEFPIHAYGARGTKDWNYIEAQGKGVYVGDTLAVMNPVKEWWGEGDEKIYVDGEKFPSHFGTGTEDYYGYAWCWPVAFQHPFHAQPRVDGNGKDNWGHTTVTRVRSLDAIPFTKSLKFDMEVWHWRECEEAYAATTYWYALPGATCNRPPQPEDAAKPIPQPPPRPQPFKIAGAIECESMDVVARTEGIPTIPQDMESFGRGKWSGESQLWFQGVKPGDFVELKIPVDGATPRRVVLYATKSWDYGIVQFSINGKKASEAMDLFSGAQGKVAPTGPIDLGVFEPVNGAMTLRAELVGANPAALASKAFFGLDCVVLKGTK